MVSSLLKSTTDSKSFLWTFPECPVRIYVNLQFIDRLRKVLDAAPADQEIGGLLIGKELPQYGDIEVSDYLPLPPGSESTRNFVVCSDALSQAIKSATVTQGQVVGFYRTHLEPRIQLRREDLECARAKFGDPMNVFLAIRPHDGRPSAAFFYWQDGAVNGGLTFPFSRAELSTSSWTTLVGGTRQPSRLQVLFADARDRVVAIGAGIRTGLIVVIAILIALAVAWRVYQPTSATTTPPAVTISHAPAPGTPQLLGLRVEKALMGVIIAWNPESSEITSARDANLLIWDGSNQPVFIRLTPAQLHAGRAFYTSVNDRVEVRMDVIGSAGQARTESIVAAGRAPDIVSPGTNLGTSALVPPITPIKPVSPPPAINSSADNSPKPPAEKPRAPTRIFTPVKPVAKANAASAEMPKPPEIESANAGLTALTQTFHSFNDPQAAAPPKVPPPPVPVREVPIPQRQTVLDAPTRQTAPVVPPARAPASSFQAAVAVREIRPQIPPQLKQMVQVENVVEIQVHINAAGKVTAAKIGSVKGPSAGFLSKLALNAALGWQFRPATENGQPVPSDKVLAFQFQPSSR